jgi:hypothetical protein
MFFHWLQRERERERKRERESERESERERERERAMIQQPAKGGFAQISAPAAAEERDGRGKEEKGREREGQTYVSGQVQIEAVNERAVPEMESLGDTNGGDFGMTLYSTK